MSALVVAVLCLLAVGGTQGKALKSTGEAIPYTEEGVGRVQQSRQHMERLVAALSVSDQRALARLY